MIFFCSKRQLQAWKEHKPPQLFIDGYHKVPGEFAQMITIMGFFPVYGKALPIIHCLMDNRTADSYNRYIFLMFL